MQNTRIEIYGAWSFDPVRQAGSAKELSLIWHQDGQANEDIDFI